MAERNPSGEALRAAREQRGLSIEAAAAAAGIPVQYVRLLEGEAEVQIGIADEFYLIPFFRRYATYLDLDAASMLPEFLHFVQKIPGEGSPPIRPAYRSWLTRAWQPAAVLAAILTAGFLLVQQVPEESASTSDPATVDSEPAQIATASGLAPTPTPLPPSSPTATPTHEPRLARELRIAARAETWVSVAVDGGERKSVLLRPGDSKTWRAEKTFSLTLGNAGGVSLTLDGRELPPPGQSGAVVRLTLPDGG